MKHSILTRLHGAYAVRALCEARISRLAFHACKCEAIGARYEDAIAALKDWLSRLDSNPYILTSDFMRCFGGVEEHCKFVFGEYWPKEARVPSDDPVELYIVEMLDLKRRSTRLARVSELRYRLSQEMQCAVQAGDFVVFNTLTCRSEMLEAVFAKRSAPWHAYMQRWRRQFVGHRYFAVIERGTKSGRLHIHVVHMFHLGRGGLRDPNYGASRPHRREINELKKWWTAGFSTPIAVRFGPGDAFAKLGWRWPVECNTGGMWVPIKPHPEIALARYVSKYVLKEYMEEKGRKIWRTKMTRGLGLDPLKIIMRELPTRTLSQLIANPYLLKVHQDKRLMLVPKSLIELEATREWLSRATKRHPILLFKVLKRVKKRLSYVEQLRTLTRTRPCRNLPSIIDTRTQRRRSTDISEVGLVTENVFDVTVLNEKKVRVSGDCRS